MWANPPIIAVANHVLRPETPDRKQALVEKVVAALGAPWLRRLYGAKSRWPAMIRAIDAAGESLRVCSESELNEKIRRLRTALRRDGFQEPLVIESFALVRETAERVLGMRHFESQLMGGLVLLYGRIAEMNTGEGKTLTATLAAATAALAGVPVHVITVNDYLSERDAEEMRPLYEALGISVGCVVHAVPQSERRLAYAADITYCTNKELTFDYLRDRLLLGEGTEPLRLQAEYLYGKEARVHQLLLRGLHFAIIDEADSVLIDEARTPLVISSNTQNLEEERVLREAADLAEAMVKERDFKMNQSARQISLTPEGRVNIAERSKALGPLWTGTVRREGLVQQALTARYLFVKDVDYLVRDGKIQIIDEHTGRVMADRSWERGLHQLMEIKEGCELTSLRETLARMSYQRFFRRYLHVSGMTGTAREVAAELWSVYGLAVSRVAPHRPSRRQYLPPHYFRRSADKWQAVVERVQQLHKQGRPVLVGCNTVSASESLSERFTQVGLAHRVLNAKQDAEEAEVIACAGQAGQITIATSMAGRGTDIKLDDAVQEKGGLYVILTQRFDAARNDRQLAGRCARQGDPGSYEEFLSLEESAQEPQRLAWWQRSLLGAPGRGSGLDLRSAAWLLRAVQARTERMHARIRRSVWRHDEQRKQLLSFSGRGE